MGLLSLMCATVMSRIDARHAGTSQHDSLRQHDSLGPNPKAASEAQGRQNINIDAGSENLQVPDPKLCFNHRFCA